MSQPRRLHQVNGQAAVATRPEKLVRLGLLNCEPLEPCDSAPTFMKGTTLDQWTAGQAADHVPAVADARPRPEARPFRDGK